MTSGDWGVYCDIVFILNSNMKNALPELMTTGSTQVTELRVYGVSSLGGLRKRSKRKWFLKSKNTPKKEFGACAVNQNITFLRENRALRKIDRAKRIIHMQVWKYV